MTKSEIAILSLSGQMYCDPEIIVEIIKDNKELLSQFKDHLRGNLEFDQLLDSVSCYL